MDLQQRLAALPTLRGQFGVNVPAPVNLIFQLNFGSVNDINLKTRYQAPAPAPAPSPAPAPAPQLAPASASASVSFFFW